MENESFDEYMKYYKNLPLKEKQSIAIDQLKMLATLTNKMCEELNVKNEMLMNRELLDINKGEYTEDDFSEALIVLINSVQNSLCDFDLKLTQIFQTQNIDIS